MATKKTGDSPNESAISISLDETVREVLNRALGEGRWQFEVKYVNYPVGYVAVNGELRVYDENGVLKQSAPGLSMIPLTDDPNATAMNAIAVSQRVAAKLMGWDVEVPEFKLAKRESGGNANSTQTASAPAARSFPNSGNGNSRPAKNNDDEEDDTPSPCEECGNDIVGYEANSGRYMTVSAQKKMSAQYGKELCRACNSAAWKAAGGGKGGNGGGNRGGGFGGNRGNYGGGGRRFN